jgi:hypothetical protein
LIVQQFGTEGAVSMLAKNELTPQGPEVLPAADGSDEAGRTLVEQLLVLGIGGLLLAGSIVLGTTVYANLSSNSATQQVGALMSNVKALYAGSTGYGSTSLNATLISAGEVPVDMLVNGAITNAWGGAVTVTGGGQTFTIKFDSVPQAACVKLASTNLSGVTGVQVGTANARTPPVTPDQANLDCAAGANTMVWTAN